MGRIYFE